MRCADRSCSARRLAAAIGLMAGVVLVWPPDAWPQCVPADPPIQPQFPTEMQTVITLDDMAKTVEVEKEVFLCDLDRDGKEETIRDVNIYTEIIEDLRLAALALDSARPPVGRGRRVFKSFEVVTCEKDIATATLRSCKVTRPGPLPADVGDFRLPSPPSPEPPAIGACCQCPTSCFQVLDPADCPAACPPVLGATCVNQRCVLPPPPAPPTPDTYTIGLFSDPVVLNAVASRRGLVKSVHLEKEAFVGRHLTTDKPVVKLVSVFTEVLEDLRRRPPVVLSKTVEVASCIKDPSTGEVLGCSVEHRRIE